MLGPSKGGHGPQALAPRLDTFEGAVMVADISGFTRLTEQLSRGSKAAFGVELLTKCMNSYFSKANLAPAPAPIDSSPPAACCWHASSAAEISLP